jgi:hypothetical protein
MAITLQVFCEEHHQQLTSMQNIYVAASLLCGVCN